MAPPTVIFLAALFGFVCIHAQIWQKQMFIILEKFDNCPEYHNYTSLIRNVEITVVKSLMKVNFDAHVLKDSGNILESVVDIQRCSSREKLDTCMVYSKMRTSRLCNMFEQKGQAWTPFMTCIEPRMVCPLRKGVYRGRNCTFDAETYRFFPVQGAYWRLRTKILESKAIRSCMDIFGYVKEH